VSLSPPSAVLGLAAALGRWDYVMLMGFLIALTFVGILLGGWAALRYQGVRPERPSAERGSGRRVVALIGTVVLLLSGMIAWQTQAGPSFAKSDRARSATQLVERVVADADGYRLLTVNARFTPGRGDWHDGEGLLLNVVVAEDQAVGRAGAEEALRLAIREQVLSEMEGVLPFVNLTLLP
jgi:uncharacterized membrane protein